MTLIILIEVFSQNSFMQGIYVRKKKTALSCWYMQFSKN